MAKRIAVQRTDREFLMKAFGVTRVAIWKALTFESDSELSKRIRNLALQRGGTLLAEVAMDDPSTIHDSDGCMRQYFGNGASIEFDKTDGHAEVSMGGEVKKTYDTVLVKDIAEIQQYAMSL